MIAATSREAASKSRLVVLDTVYHQAPGDQPTIVESRFSRAAQSDEQPYSRRVKITETWQPLDCGWLAAAGMLVIRNEEGQFTQVQPTDAQREEAAAKVIEVAMAPPDLPEPPRTMHSPPKVVLEPEPFALVRPGESPRFEPASVSRLLLRCRSGVARCTVTLFPQ